MILTIRNGEESFAIPIRSELLNGISALQARSESFKLFHIKSNKFPCIIESQDVENNVFVPTTIVHQPHTWIRVLNCTNDVKLIITTKLRSSDIDDYEVIKCDEKSINSDERLVHLKNVLSTKIPEHAKAKLMPLCFEFSDIFHLEGDKATVKNFYTQHLNVKYQNPVYIKNYRLPHTQKVEINKQVHELLENDLIEMCNSNYNSPLIIVPKKSTDGKKRWRMCIDFKTLNRKLVPDRFPLPRTDEILDGLGRAKYFSIMDLHPGYHQIPLERGSRRYTAFSTDSGHFQWKVLPFGLNIAPSPFLRMMTLAFSSLTPEKCFIYMDDLITIGFSENNNIHNLRKIFETCRRYNSKINPNKCQFFRTEVSFFGHRCTAQGLPPDPSKIIVMQKYPVPKNADETKRFVAFANYYRRFIGNFSGITKPLSNLTRKKVKFVWTEECQRAFEKIKQLLTSPTILTYSDFSKPFRVTVDASQKA